MSAPGPPELGRGVIVAAGAAPPDPWAAAPRIEIDQSALADPGPVVAELHAAWAARKPAVISLGVDPARFREPQVIDEPPYALAPDLDLPLDRLHHLVWANSYDARSGEPIWWWARKAASAEVGVDPGGPADVMLADGGRAWIDGGPRWSAPSLDLPTIHAGSVERGGLAPVPAEIPPPRAELAADQLAAVGDPGGPVRVIAPAGSGKTRVLTERLRHLLADRGYDRDAVLAVAYNKLAQLELEQRLAELAPRTQTLNALGYAVLTRRSGSRPPLLPESEVRELVEATFPIPRQRRTNTDPVGPYIDALGAVRLGLRDPVEVEAARDDVPGLADRFDRYRTALAERGAVDFDEQVYGALEALLADGRFRRAVQREHRHLLVDEFQDLTPAHVLLIRLLAMPALDVFGVGDDDQTIYDHAGADPRFLVDYGNYFDGAGAVALETNYRCARAIVGAAATLLAYNRIRVDKRIRPAAGAAGEPEALRLEPHPSGEAARRLVELVGGWLTEPGADPEQVAVLARVNSLLLAPQVALWAAGVPVNSRVGPELLERTGVAAALAWIRVAVAPDDLIGQDLELIRRRPSRGFPRWISKWLGRCRSIADLRRVAAKIDDERVAMRVDELADDVELLAGMAGGGADTRGLLEAIRDRIGLGEAMAMLDGSKGSEAVASHLDDLEGLILLADLEPDPAVFEPWLNASLRESAGARGVTLSTVHRVKGREWDRVAVFGMTEGLVPHRLSSDWEAERRVLHVAITRARRSCVVLGDEGRRSPFWDELCGKADEPARAPSAALAARAAEPPSAVGRRGPVEIPDTAAGRALQAWRTERSRADAVPAYVVLSNRELAGIAEALPTDARALLACNGIGPTKLDRYGEEILAVLDSARE